MNPSVVAQHVHTPFLISGVWITGGMLALLGAFIWAELATRLPEAGGQYVYWREAYHPCVAFVYGWVLLLVTQTGGMAAVAVTFARYFREISGVTWSDSAIAATVLLALTAINCFGARAGSNVQSALMLTKTLTIAAMIVLGLAFGGGHLHPLPLLDRPVSSGLFAAIGAAMIPVGFAYGGWQTSTFVAGEMRNPARDLIVGVAGVVVNRLSCSRQNQIKIGPLGRPKRARRTQRDVGVVVCVDVVFPVEEILHIELKAPCDCSRQPRPPAYSQAEPPCYRLRQTFRSDSRYQALLPAAE